MIKMLRLNNNCLLFFSIVLVVFSSRGSVNAEPTIHSKEQLGLQCEPARFRIAIDVGHTPEASGAISARGVPEFNFNLSLGKVVAALLVRSGFTATQLLLTSGVGHSQLHARTSRANDMSPDLFLSLHHDSVQHQYMSQWTVNGKSSSYSDKFAGFSIFVASDNSFSKLSIEFAKLLSDALTSQGLRYSLHHAEKIRGESRVLLDAGRGIYSFNQLVVLRQTKAPAVLLEAGVIVNRAEEVILESSEFREKISSSVLDAIKSFCLIKQSRR